MEAEILQSAEKLQTIPARFLERTAYDEETNTLYVDRGIKGNPLFLTWKKRNADAGNTVSVVEKDADQIAKLRTEGMRIANSQDADLKVRAHAIDIITTASNYHASDIHLMMRGTHSEIQIVVKSSLRVLCRLTQEEGEALARTICQLAIVKEPTFEPLQFQSAQITGDVIPSTTRLSSIRIIRGPCYPVATGGSFMSMRLQYLSSKSNFHVGNLPTLLPPRQPEGTFELGQRGFSEKQIAKLKFLLRTPTGIVIVNGPTGSGKTDTLNQLLTQLAREKPHLRQVSVEDPVEHPMDWAVQLPVTGTKDDADTGNAFAERIRVMMRMAPSIIFVGELRGPTVAVAALEAALTGHQVFTTLHTTDPFLFVERFELMDSMRLKRGMFCDHKIVRASIAQRLLPQLCPDCSLPLSTNTHLLETRLVSALESWGDINEVRLKGPGCATCNHDGTTRRFAVAEIVVTDEKLMNDFIEHGSETARRNYRARENTDPSLLEAAIQHVLSGLVDPAAVEESIDVICVKEDETTL